MKLYSLSHNTADNIDYAHADWLSTHFSKYDIKHIITAEHLDQTAEKKDHIQCAYMTNSAKFTPARLRAAYIQKFKRDFSKVELHIKQIKIKPNWLFAFGYCLKEVPHTARVLSSTLSDIEAKQASAFYLEHQDDADFLSSPWEQFVTIVHSIQKKSGWYCTFDEAYNVYRSTHFDNLTISNSTYAMWKRDYEVVQALQTEDKLVARLQQARQEHIQRKAEEEGRRSF